MVTFISIDEHPEREYRLNKRRKEEMEMKRKDYELANL